MNTLDKLVQTARHSGQLMAEDKASGVRVVAKFTHLGWSAEYFINGQRKGYPACLKHIQMFDNQMGEQP